MMPLWPLGKSLRGKKPPAFSAAKVPNARRNRITELLNLTLCSTTKSTSDTPPGPRPFQTENYPPFELDCTRLQSNAAPSVRVLIAQPLSHENETVNKNNGSCSENGT